MSGELLAQTFARQIDAATVEHTGNVGEVDPLKETVSSGRTLGESFDPQVTLFNDDRLPRVQTVNRPVTEAHVCQCHAFAGRREHVVFNRVAQWLDPLRIATDKHVTQCVQKDDVPGTIEPLGQSLQDTDEVADTVVFFDFGAEFLRQNMHQDFRVCLARQMKVVVLQNLVAHRGVVRKLPVEGKTEPLGLFNVVPFKRLRIAGVVSAARRIPHVSNCGRAGVFCHQLVVLVVPIEVKDLAHAADSPMRVNELFSCGVERREPRRELTSVLNIQQNAGHETRCLFTSLGRSQPTGGSFTQ